MGDVITVISIQINDVTDDQKPYDIGKGSIYISDDAIPYFFLNGKQREKCDYAHHHQYLDYAAALIINEQFSRIRQATNINAGTF